MSKKELMTQSFKELKKGSAEPCFELLNKLLKNIIDSQPESEESQKFRTVKKKNKKLKQFVTSQKAGVRLMELIGFTLQKNE